MKTLIELFPDVDAPAVGIKDRVHQRVGLHQFDAQTRPSLGHPLLVFPIGVIMMLLWALAGVYLTLFAVGLFLGAHWTGCVFYLASAVLSASMAAVTSGFDEFDFQFTLMGERLAGDSRHLLEIKRLRRELGLTSTRDRLANRTYFRRKTYRLAIVRMRHSAMVYFRAWRVSRLVALQHQSRIPATVPPVGRVEHPASPRSRSVIGPAAHNARHS